MLTAIHAAHLVAIDKPGDDWRRVSSEHSAVGAQYLARMVAPLVPCHDGAGIGRIWEGGDISSDTWYEVTTGRISEYHRSIGTSVISD